MSQIIKSRVQYCDKPCQAWTLIHKHHRETLMQCQQQQSPLLAPCTYTIKYIIQYYNQTAYINPKGPNQQAIMKLWHISKEKNFDTNREKEKAIIVH